MIWALASARLFCNSSSYLQSSSQSSQSPLKKQAEVPISSFLLTAMRRGEGGGGDCRVSCRQEAQLFFKALKFTTRVAVSPALVETLQVCYIIM